ncbi:acetate kinase [Methylosoma difficile]
MNWTLVINVGSTSVKTALFGDDLQLKAALNASHDSHVWHIDGQGLNGLPVAVSQSALLPVSNVVASFLHNWRCLLQKAGIALTAIGHRVVHGGSLFRQLTAIDDGFLAKLATLDAYAPLHNPANRLGMVAAHKTFPDVAQFAVFDTAFHRSMPDMASRYAIPAHLSATVDFHRFGFHGISCQHSVSATAKRLGCAVSSLNLIVLHLGGGASITAIKAGVSVDTSMGFSPMAGLVMASRCGDLDPAIVLALQKQGWSAEQLDRLLNQQSGLQGICGETDMRAIIDRAEQNDDAAKLALAMYCYRIKKYIGAYCAVLGEVSALIFTGGVGEHAPIIRAKVLAGLEPLGFVFDEAANAVARHNSDISTHTGTIRILVIRAEEEREIARQIQVFQAQA